MISDSEEALLPKEPSEADDHQLLEDLRGLVKHRGWTALISLLNEQGFTKKTALLTEPIGKREAPDLMTAICCAEFDKGWVAALAFFIALPQNEIAILINKVGLDKPKENEDD